MFKSSGYLWATPKSLMMFSNLCLQQAYYFSLLKGASNSQLTSRASWKLCACFSDIILQKDSSFLLCEQKPISLRKFSLERSASMLRRHLGTCREIHVVRNGGFQQIFGKERKPDGSQVSKRGPGAAFPSMSASSRAQLWVKQQASLLCKVSVPNPYGCRKPGVVLKPLVPCFCRKRFSSVRLSVYVFRLQIQ